MGVILPHIGDLQTQRNISIPILIILLEDICHPFQTNTGLHEQIETNGILAPSIIRPIQKRDKLRREPVSEGNERLVEFSVGYASRSVCVESVEEAAPCREKAPESAVRALEVKWWINCCMETGRED
jgi:hypothetical protein